MTHNADLLARRQAVVARGVGQFAGPVTAATAHGATIVDADGTELIDFAGGIGVMNVGHCDPHVVQAIREQAGKLIHACIHVATYEPYVALCEKLASMFPHGEGSKVMLANSGAEAVENAIKIARQATGRGGVLCYTESFHGRTLLCATLTSKVGYKVGCGPFAPEVYRLPYPNRFRYGAGLDKETFAHRELARLEQSFFNTVAPGDLAAIILECVQGEGGFVSAPRTYIEGLRRICDEHGIILIFDEVQSGFCRTGEWAAYQHYDVEPDLSTWAKSMGGGMPISAVIGKKSVMDAAAPGTLGGTYGGNPVACAAALATIEVMERDGLNERARVIGERIELKFMELQEKCPAIAHARGLGAMRAMVFMESGDPPRAATETVRAIITACYERGLLVIPAGTFGHILRVLCPLVITDEQLERGLTILEEEVLRFAGATAVPLNPRKDVDPMVPFAIAGMQLHLSGRHSNLEHIKGRLEMLMYLYPWVQMVVVSELATFGGWTGHARPLPNEAEEAYQEFAARHKIWLVPGSFFEQADGVVYNTAPVINPAGEVIARYRKMFPFLPYETGVEPGSEFCVFDVPDIGRFGLSICYDMWFPETSRTLAALGAEVILHPTLTASIDRDVELSIARATAATNQCFVFDINGVGDGGIGRSTIVSPVGDVLYQAGHAEEMIPIELDLARVRRTREVGLRGLGQPLKSFRDSTVDFAVYRRSPEMREYLETLGPLVKQSRGSLAGIAENGEDAPPVAPPPPVGSPLPPDPIQTTQVEA